jgi:hypothetical protein
MKHYVNKSAEEKLTQYTGRRVVIDYAISWEGSRLWCERYGLDPTKMYAYATFNRHGAITEPNEAFRTVKALVQSALKVLPKDTGQEIYM